MRIKRNWKVFYIEAQKDGLFSGRRIVPALTREIAEGKVGNNDNRMVTGSEPMKPIRHKKIQ